MKQTISSYLKLAALPAVAVTLGLGLSQTALAAGDASEAPKVKKETLDKKVTAEDAKVDETKKATEETKKETAEEPKKKVFAVKCKEGKVWVKKKLRCIDEGEVKKEDQSSIYELGRDYAYAGDYRQAIKVLLAAPDQSDPRVNNMLGFSNRKSGNMDVAMTHYQKAISVNPDYSLVREYLGEAFIQLGMFEKAREQLTEIERICGGRSCDEYGQLARLMVKSQL